MRQPKRFTIAGLVVMGLAAATLSGMALLQHRPAPESMALPPVGSPASPGGHTEGEPSASATSTGTTPSPSTSATATAARVVVIGDSYSVGKPASTWIGDASKELEWGDVVNLSAPGRGFVKKPRSCEADPCAPFPGSVDLIAAEDPTMVITFGGSADGDGDISAEAQSYFAALREALPHAELVALSPLTTRDAAPAWLDRSASAIAAAVTAVEGRFIDIGQPGLGDGQTLSADTQAEIGRLVAQALSSS